MTSVRLLATLSLSFFACAAGYSRATNDAPAMAPDQVLVSGKTVKVTKADFDQELKNIPEDSVLEFISDLGRIQRMLERLTHNKLAVVAARDTGFSNDPEIAADLEHTMESRLAALYFAQLSKSIKVPNLEARAKEMFLVNADNLAIPEHVRASHILINFKSRSREEALKRAEEVRQKALAGEPFDKLAKEFSDEPSAKQNAGDLGLFPATKMVPAFSKAAFALQKPGDISPIVETQFGYHIIRLVERQPRKPAVYEAHHAELLADAERDYRAAEFQKLVAKMVADDAPKADEDAVARLKFNIDMNDLIKKSKLPAPAGGK
jgi:peptidyl-prolyl cis-trans isomerase C